MNNQLKLVEFNNKKYELAKLSSKITNKSNTIQVLLVDHRGYITVGEGFRIYNGKSGKPILKSRFTKVGDAIRFAEWINDTYNDYLVIWEHYPTANVIRWCRYTVKGGFILDRMIEILEEKEEISDLDVSAAWNTARKEVENDYQNRPTRPKLLS